MQGDPDDLSLSLSMPSTTLTTSARLELPVSHAVGTTASTKCVLGVRARAVSAGMYLC